MENKTVAIRVPHGLHLRVAAEIVKIAKKYDSKITLSCADSPQADGSSIIELVLLQATQGTAVKIQADGPGERKAVEEIDHLFTDGGGI